MLVSCSMECEAVVCEREAKVTGLCRAHYSRKRQGRPMDVPLHAPRGRGLVVKPVEDRLTYEVSAAGCWEYDGHITPQGYGVLQSTDWTEKAHRLAYKLWVGPIPEGLWVLHHCDNRKCINPEHLYAGDHLDNMADMVRRGRGRNEYSPLNVSA